MSKDPAFLFYPADASNDTQFMSRLEKGAYFDLVKSQRMFGGFTTVQLRKILGTDFEAVWPALELVLEKDTEGKYHIPWVREALKRREEYSKKQKERINKRWNNRSNTTVLPHIENANENRNESINEVENEKKKKYRANISLTETEYQKLCTDYGTEITANAIEYLGNYKEEKNYATKSDYLTIKRWVIEAVSKTKIVGPKANGPPADYILAADGTKLYEKDIDFSKLGK